MGVAEEARASCSKGDAPPFYRTYFRIFPRHFLGMFEKNSDNLLNI
jgi:hypothetical protein